MKLGLGMLNYASFTLYDPYPYKYSSIGSLDQSSETHSFLIQPHSFHHERITFIMIIQDLSKQVQYEPKGGGSYETQIGDI